MRTASAGGGGQLFVLDYGLENLWNQQLNVAVREPGPAQQVTSSQHFKLSSFDKKGAIKSL